MPKEDTVDQKIRDNDNHDAAVNQLWADGKIPHYLKKAFFCSSQFRLVITRNPDSRPTKENRWCMETATREALDLISIIIPVVVQLADENGKEVGCFDYPNELYLIKATPEYYLLEPRVVGVA